MDIDVKVKILSDKVGMLFQLPSYATEGSAGMDLCACIDEEVVVRAGQIVKIPTGIAMQIQSKYIGGFIFPRSGLSSKHGISLINCVGVLDSDYTGEIICPVVNHSSEDYCIKPGDRIAQIVFMPVYAAKLTVTDELSETDRGSGGFGSTGA
ncbi:MAG: dUTP diphosphatase [Bacillota bacterium]